MATTIKFKKATAADWTSNNPVLASGEPGIETDTSKMKIGNGTQAWDVLTYVNEAPYVPSFGPSITRTYEGPSHTSPVPHFGQIVHISGDNDVITEVDQNGSFAKGTINIYNSTTGNLDSTMNNAPSGTKKWAADRRVAVYGDYIAVSALTAGSDPAVWAAPYQGYIYIYQLSTGNLITTITGPTSTSSSSIFGDLSMSDTYLIAGWSQYDVSGTAYVYKTTSGDWSDTTLEHTFSHSDAWSFGQSAASIRGDIAVIQAASAVVSGNNYSGKFYIYNLNTGSLLDTVENPTPLAFEMFGTSSAIIDDNTIAIGAQYEESNGNYRDGAIYIYKSALGDWSDTSMSIRIDNPNSFNAGDDEDWFGNTMATNGTYLAVVAPKEESGNKKGALYIYESSNGTWDDASIAFETLDPYDNVNGNWNAKLSMDDNRLLWGQSWGELPGSPHDHGRVHLYSLYS